MEKRVTILMPWSPAEVHTSVLHSLFNYVKCMMNCKGYTEERNRGLFQCWSQSLARM